eukprot:64627_1
MSGMESNGGGGGGGSIATLHINSKTDQNTKYSRNRSFGNTSYYQQQQQNDIYNQQQQQQQQQHIPQHPNHHSSPPQLTSNYRSNSSRMRFKPHNSDRRHTSHHHSSHHSNHHSDNKYVISSGDHRSYKNFREQQPTRYYYQDNIPTNHISVVDDDVNTGSSVNLSPNLLHHKTSSIISDASTINTLNTNGSTIPKSSRHSSIANSQQITHHYASSGHFRPYGYGSSHQSHHSHPRTTYTQSSAQMSAHDTPTYDISQHSQAVYHPYAHSTVSTATYTTDGNNNDNKLGRNNSSHYLPPFSSLPTSSNHSQQQITPMTSHRSLGSNVSMQSIHSNPYHQYMVNKYASTANNNTNDQYNINDSPYNNHHRSSHHHKDSPYNNNNNNDDNNNNYSSNQHRKKSSRYRHKRPT